MIPAEIDPRGAPVDLLRSCYTAYMRLNKDAPDKLTKVRWFFVERTDFIQNNAFVSSVYDELPDFDGCGLGEDASTRVHCSGNLPDGALIAPTPLGSPRQWAEGVQAGGSADAESVLPWQAVWNQCPLPVNLSAAWVGFTEAAYKPELPTASWQSTYTPTLTVLGETYPMRLGPIVQNGVPVPLGGVPFNYNAWGNVTSYWYLVVPLSVSEQCPTFSGTAYTEYFVWAPVETPGVFCTPIAMIFFGGLLNGELLPNIGPASENGQPYVSMIPLAPYVGENPFPFDATIVCNDLSFVQDSVGLSAVFNTNVDPNMLCPQTIQITLGTPRSDPTNAQNAPCPPPLQVQTRRPPWYPSATVTVEDPDYGTVTLTLAESSLTCYKSLPLPDGSAWMWLGTSVWRSLTTPLSGQLFFAKAWEQWRPMEFVSMNVFTSTWAGVHGIGRVFDSIVESEQIPN